MSCENCGSLLVKNGIRKLKYRDPVQQYICRKRCGYAAEINTFKGMWYPQKLVILAVDLYTIGTVTARIVEVVYEQYSIWISESVIYVWEERFSRKIPKHEFENLSKMLHDDDTQFPMKQTGRKLRQFGLKCPKTKIMKTHVCEGKAEGDVREHFWKAKQSFKPSYTPGKIRTDSLPSYYPAINKVFGRDAKQDRFKSFKNHSNNEIENEWRAKKEFHRFDSVEQAQAWNALWEWRRNFIRVHAALKKTPAEAAGQERGSWRDVVRISETFIMRMLELIPAYLYCRRQNGSMKKGAALAIETTVLLVLAVVVLATLLFMFFGIAKDPTVQIELKRTSACRAYAAQHPKCDSPSADQDTLTKLGEACKGLSGYSACAGSTSASLACILQCCSMFCPGSAECGDAFGDTRTKPAPGNPYDAAHCADTQRDERNQLVCIEEWQKPGGAGHCTKPGVCIADCT